MIKVKEKIGKLTPNSSTPTQAEHLYIPPIWGIASFLIVSNPIGTKSKFINAIVVSILRASFKSHRDKVKILYTNDLVCVHSSFKSHRDKVKMC